MDFSLTQKQELKLFLTQTMKISLNILEMSTYDLEKFILKEKEKNPVIEIDFSDKRTLRSKESCNDALDPFDLVSKEESLIDYLEEQVGYLKISKEMRFLCVYLINNLDKKGHLPLKKQEIKESTGYPMKEIEKAMEIVKNLEPVGIGTENLESCLIFQLHKKNIYDNKIEYLIKYFLKEIASGNYKIIEEKLDITKEEILAYLKIIRTLNPIPSRGFYMGEPTNYISPEARIEKIGEDYKVIMLNNNLPNIKIKNIKETKENKNYFTSAQGLIKAIEKRQGTLEDILNLVLKKQYTYFSQEEGKLKTFTLKEVAKSLEIHESTVSRAIKNKYVETEKGIKRIKDMFVLNEEKYVIYSIIEDMVIREDRKKPYTDQYMVDEIKKQGIDIARRTVAKYREELGIESTSRRKIKL